MEYKIGDQELSAAAFIGFANKVWPGRYEDITRKKQRPHYPKR
jgi:lambda repressor-like predicted transcriptional regulator